MNIKKKIITIPILIFFLSGCSALVPSGTETAFKYIGITKGVADTVTYQSTGKTINDHVLSAAIGQDCKLGRIITKKPICIEIDTRSQKYSIFNKGKVISKNNVVQMQFPSEIYEFNKTLKKDVKKKLENSRPVGKKKHHNFNYFK